MEQHRGPFVVETPQSSANDSQLAQLLSNMHNQLKEMGEGSDDQKMDENEFSPSEIDKAMANGMGLKDDSKLDDSTDVRQMGDGDNMELNYRDIGCMEQQEMGQGQDLG